MGADSPFDSADAVQPPSTIRRSDEQVGHLLLENVRAARNLDGPSEPGLIVSPGAANGNDVAPPESSPNHGHIYAAAHKLHPDHLGGFPAAQHASTTDHLTDFYRALHRRKAGVMQAAQHVTDLQNEPNEVFVEKISEDCHIGPHWEWIPTAGIMVAKAGAKGYVLSKAGEAGGVMGKVAGGAFGLGWGAAAGLYTGYHLTEYKENACISDNLEKRLLQFQPGGKNTQPPVDTTTLPLPTMPDEVPLRGVRDVVHSVSEQADELWYGLRGKPVPNKEFENAEKVEAKDSLSRPEFTAWAKEESKGNQWWSIAKEGLYAGTAYLTSSGVLNKLHIARGGNPAVKIGAALVGAGLAWAGTREGEHERFVELESARTISKPDDFPDNASFVDWAKREAAADPFYKYGKEGTFGGIGYLGATYTAIKLGLGPRGGIAVKAGGIAIGAALGWLGTASHEQKALADLYTARLISKPDDSP